MGKHFGIEGVGSNVQLGKGGPRVKNNAGAIEHRNAGDSALVIARVATPVGNDDAATKAYVDATVKAYGEMYLTATSAVAAALYPTFAVLGGTTALGDASGFDMPANNRLRRTGAGTKKVKVTVSLAASSSGPTTYWFAIGKNGVAVVKSRLPRYMSGTNDTGAMPLSCIVDLAQNDYISIMGARTGATARNLTMEAVNVRVETY